MGQVVSGEGSSHPKSANTLIAVCSCSKCFSGRIVGVSPYTWLSNTLGYETMLHKQWIRNLK